MPTVSREAVLELLRQRAPRSVHATELCQQLGVSKKDRDQVLDVLDTLAELGFVRQMPGLRFRLLARPPKVASDRPISIVPTERTRGRLTMHPRGFGFVAVQDGGLDAFIPPTRLGGALHGDLVVIDARPSTKGREGEVVEILERGLRRVSGTLNVTSEHCHFEPDDARMRGPMLVAGELDGRLPRGAVVVAEIVAYPQNPEDYPVVQIVEVLGAHGTTKVEVAKIKLREGVIEEFPLDVTDEAALLPDRITAADRRDREDLRDLDLVTIDPSDARDHDDALFAEELDDGNYRVVIAVADVSHYVREGTAIDREAIRRGVSIYLPDRAIPMLPAALSSNLASLLPKRDRLCLAVDVELAPNGKVLRHQFVEAVMRSGAKLTYPGVAYTMGWTREGSPEPAAERRRRMLDIMFRLSRKLRQRRMRRGSLDFELPEARVALDPTSLEPVDVYRSRRDPGIKIAYQLVEEFMLLANELVATQLTDADLPTVYRIHPPPDQTRLETFVELASALGHPIDPEAVNDPKTLSAFLQALERPEHVEVLSYLLLRAMSQASYDIQNTGHFALAIKNYVHFTSPIRRYPDVWVHRVLRMLIRGEPVDSATLRPRLRHAAAETSWLERRAMSVERAVVDLYRAILMQHRRGEEFEATITGITDSGFYCTFDAPFVEALVPTERLSDNFEIDPLGIRLHGVYTGITYALGDRLTVVLEEIRISAGQLVALPAHEPTPESRRRRRQRPRSERRQAKSRKGRKHGRK